MTTDYSDDPRPSPTDDVREYDVDADVVRPGDPCTVTVTPSEGGGVTVDVCIPGYDIDVHLIIDVERDGEGDWKAYVPWVDELKTTDAGQHHIDGIDVLNGIMYIGAPDVERPREQR